MKRFFNGIGLLILMLLVAPYLYKPRIVKWRYVFLALAIGLLIARVIWVAVKG